MGECVCVRVCLNGCVCVCVCVFHTGSQCLERTIRVSFTQAASALSGRIVHPSTTTYTAPKITQHHPPSSPHLSPPQTHTHTQPHPPTVQFHAALGKAYLVVSNVGDSPVLLIDNRSGRVQLLTGRHSWDNPEERQRYLDRCAALGLTPRDVVYGRINCGGMRLEDANGGEEPFRMYLPGTATVDPQTRDHLNRQVERRFRNSIGGSQSIRRFLWERRDPGTGAWETYRALEEHAHGNWGATVLVRVLSRRGWVGMFCGRLGLAWWREGGRHATVRGLQKMRATPTTHTHTHTHTHF